MKAKSLHPWGLSVAEAREVRLAPLVSATYAVKEPQRYIAGVDISGADEQGECLGTVVVLAYPELEVAEVQTVRRRPLMPYVPGLLSFRETPVYASIGHKIDLEGAVRWIMACRGKYRVPEPTRRAHIAVSGTGRGTRPVPKQAVSI